MKFSKMKLSQCGKTFSMSELLRTVQAKTGRPDPVTYLFGRSFPAKDIKSGEEILFTLR